MTLMLFLIVMAICALGFTANAIRIHVKEIRDKIFEDLQDGNQEEQSEPGNYGTNKHRK